LPPGIYFRLLLIGYFEGIDSSTKRLLSHGDLAPFRHDEFMLMSVTAK
jgi:hypothetical protein